MFVGIGRLVVEESKPTPKSYLHGTSTTGFTKVTYGVEGGTRYEYFPPSTSNMTSAHTEPIVWIDPDRPLDADNDF